MDEEAVPVDTEDFEPMETVPKKVRHRKKKLYQAILQQMEFYFSDSNLLKDRFLGKLVQDNDGYVDLSVFLTFNRIKNLTPDAEDIAKALRNSEMLNVSEDGSKVRRVTPVKEKENIDDCTIYVEQLPPDADHDWLRLVFTTYGKVTYVSIPKYKRSGKIKGFAFVEFDTPEEANKTLKEFGAMGCCLPTQIPPEQLCSIATFEHDGDVSTVNTGFEVSTPVKNPSKRKQHADSNENDGTVKEESNEEIPKKKRKLTTDSDNNPVEQVEESQKKKDHESELVEDNKEEVGQVEEFQKKKKDHEIELVEDNKEEVGQVEEPHKKKKKQEDHDELVEDNKEDIGQVEEPRRKRRKKKNKKDHEFELVEDNKIEVSEGAPSDEEKVLKKIKKRETKSLEESEINVSENERKIRKRKHSEPAEDKEAISDEEGCRKQAKTEDSAEDQEVEEGHDEGHKKRRNRKRKKKNKKEKGDTDGTKSGLRILSKREWKRLRNKYLELQKKKMKSFKQYLNKSRWAQQNQFWREGKQDSSQGDGDYMEMVEEVKPESQMRTVFTPGVIVHVSLDTPVEDAKQFKAEARVYPDVKYIDVREGTTEVYLRCLSSEAAKQFVSKSPWKQMNVLEGEEETSYWEKIKCDREQKLGMKVRSKRLRGRDRLLKQGETVLGKHMRFDDLEEQEKTT